MGDPVTADMIRALEGLELGSSTVSMPARTHSLVSQGSLPLEQLRTALGSSPVIDRITAFTTRPPWTETDQIMAGEVPVELLRHIVSVIRDGTPG